MFGVLLENMNFEIKIKRKPCNQPIEKRNDLNKKRTKK